MHLYDTELSEKLLQYKVCKLSQSISETDEAYSFRNCHNMQICSHILLFEEWILGDIDWEEIDE